MVNRTFEQQSLSILKRQVSVWGVFSVGADGAVTLQKWNYPALGGSSVSRTYSAAPTGTAGIGYPQNYQIGADCVKSVTRTGTGLWTVTLQDNYQRMLMLECSVSIAGGLTNIVAVGENSTISNMSAANGSVIGVALLSANGTAADPTSGSIVRLKFELQDATEP
jgi:hypothetical protein